MAKYYDNKLKEYIFSNNFRNSSFEDYIEYNDDYQVSSDSQIKCAEKAYFSYIKHKKIDNSKVPSSEYIFNFESKLIEVLADMEINGFHIDEKKLKEIGYEISIRVDKIEEEIYSFVGERFNLNSPKQLQVILFDKLNIPKTKKIKTGYSVDNDALEFIGKNHVIANMILEHRGLRKLLTTYVDGLVKTINKNTSKIHTTFNQTGASTGRLSSENPNMQNIPAGDGYGGEIKSCFIPSSKKYKILVADYSQVELRVLANLSKDKVLLEAFKNNEDIHTRTAKYLFGDKKISSEERRKAKTVNFGVIYGISGFGLSKQIKTSPAEATEYINKFYELYSGVREYYDNLLIEARSNGYVETYFGRKRYIKNINDANKIIKSQAEREAINMRIQGTAADIIKLAMIEIDEYIKKKNLKSKMILQVHDELVFELHEDELELENKIKEIMENIVKFEAKLIVESGIGDNWKVAKK